MRKRFLGTVLSLTLVSCISVMGTLAYLTDRDSVANTFTVGNVDITLNEADVDENGKEIAGAGRVTENEYHLIPGMKYDKDPTVTVNEGSEESYVRMIMKVQNASAVQNIITSCGLNDFADLLEGWDKEKWLYETYTEDTTANTISFEFRYYEAVDAKDSAVVLEPLFTELVVPGAVTGEELAALYEGNEDEQFKMILHGHAIQTASFDTEDAAWTAFDQQVNP